MDQPGPNQAPNPAADYAQARDHMVDSQVRPNKVIDPRIIRAMRSLPRERFLPPHLVSLAYADEDVPLPRGRALMEPMVIARLAQLARVRDGERVLVVGAGAGYGAALLAACGGQVTALEDDEALLAIARAVLPSLAPGVCIQAGPPPDGLPTGAPWDVVMIEGAVRAIPPALGAQVRPDGGRLVTVLAERAGAGHGVLAEHSGAGGVLRAQPVFDCATPLLPAFAARPTFQF
jgi:protein-L-isoaspartate(D-aspartate) O-methyltransferase